MISQLLLIQPHKKVLDRIRLVYCIIDDSSNHKVSETKLIIYTYVNTINWFLANVFRIKSTSTQRPMVPLSHEKFVVDSWRLPLTDWKWECPLAVIRLWFWDEKSHSEKKEHLNAVYGGISALMVIVKNYRVSTCWKWLSRKETWQMIEATKNSSNNRHLKITHES